MVRYRVCGQRSWIEDLGFGALGQGSGWFVSEHTVQNAQGNILRGHLKIEMTALRIAQEQNTDNKGFSCLIRLSGDEHVPWNLEVDLKKMLAGSSPERPTLVHWSLRS